MIHLGGGAKDPGCRVEVMVEYSVPDILDGREAYPGPVGKPGFRDMRRVCWYSGSMQLGVKAPKSGSDVKVLCANLSDVLARRMYADPLATMLLEGM
jgi:hypothetical protein